MKTVLTGLWICAVTILSCYGAVTWGSGLFAKKEEPYLEGLQYQKLPPINVPMVADGKVQGYIVAVLVFTADARLMHTLPVPPNAFVVDETFRQIYADPQIDFKRLSRYNVTQRLAEVRKAVNARLGADVVKDVLVEEFNFVAKREVRS
ncbi:hypothetical protein ASG60_02205 [Methylobacterium sp. Leaf469]|jgi:hypothetical protein|uniref:hypothetical protein n=1 Tax=unclassified Methylobacterium TaxID=2615210 RepID=UPI0006F5DED1|nr:MULTISPECIES: hypothetical protein [unclassified Methylobacterium]KQP72226.1 hypothetical protein ASF52_01445 [Methylobacterium sp. Leaf112]KQU05496.1 hypothetical protein ASG60_02205 [Methylobacterium sp. Leaf469]USU33519.1 hypothetical protein NG677_07595 [Methylobacterium sp. OTU13CASTA1]